MTKYEDLITKADFYFEKAKNTSNLDLRIFYLRCSNGYRSKANQLTLEECMEIVG